MDEQGWNELVLAEAIARRATWDSTKQVLGDDAAIVKLGSESITVCADALVEGVHFDLDYWSPRQIGAKAVTVNISDLAAMAAQPLWILSTVASPKHFATDELLVGLQDQAEHYGAHLIGGDLSRSDTVVVSVTAIGTQVAAPLRRSGARPGDLIFVTGLLGGAALALERLSQGLDLDDLARAALQDPVARVAEGFAASRAGATAAIDISDGLALDLHRLANASHVGFELDEVPIAKGATSEQALGGGEDFELLFTAPQEGRVLDEFSRATLTPPLRIGRIHSDERRRNLGATPLGLLGYRH
ncbi:thiamine-phosphate kinase [Ferrimicrobium acidiphilum]|uniref:Thiamine-monophosphate kinase n=1 Tax=Ferrimicrobium acidiphilum TaxID=121039 RepID=A0ABV3Y388_9ACTN